LSRTPAANGNAQKFTISFLVKIGTLGATYANLFGAGGISTGGGDPIYLNGNNLTLFADGGSGATLTTSQVFRDPSAWYHIVYAIDTTQATASNRIKLYVNGVQVTAFSTATYPTQNYNFLFLNKSSVVQYLGFGYTNYFDGYLTEVNFIDGQALTQSSFGETDIITGVWKPKKYAGTYGTNGFYLNFADNSNNTAATIGKDSSGNGNNWTPNNISVTAGVTYDSMLDTPTPYADGGNGRGNYCTFNPLNASLAPKNGNLNIEPSGTSGNYIAASTTGVSTGKWYYEVVATTYTGSGQAGEFGFRLASSSAATVGTSVGDASGFAFGMALATTWYSQKYGTTAVQLTGLSNATTGTIGMIAVDFDTGYAWVGKDGTWYNSGNPATGANPTITGITAGTYVATIAAYRDATRNYSYAANFGQRPFSYTPPTGFKALNTQNLPDSTIKKGNQYFDVTTYTGTGASRSVTNSGSMQPDLVWLKSRSTTWFHILQDSVRGIFNALYSNSTNAESAPGGVSAFNANGFSLDSYNNANNNADTYVAWQWKESASAGFDIVTYTGNGGSLTVNHSLGVAPAMIIAKSRGTAGTNWGVWHKNLTTASYYLLLNGTAAQATAANTIQSTPTSTSVSLGGSSVFNDAANMVMYLFAEVAGYSKFGSYTGNGSADGPFVYLGFRPRFVLVKGSSNASSWQLFDTLRPGYNANDNTLWADLSSAEGTGTARIDLLSNGFKVRAPAGTDPNVSGATYIYAVFAENPFKNSLAR
jgi:hypothetical protein